MGVDVTRAKSRGGRTRAKVDGLPELLKKLNDLRAPNTINEIAFKGTYGAAADLRLLAKINSMVSTTPRTHALEKGWAIKKIIDGGKRGYTVGVRTSNRRSKDKANDPYYWWFLEFGTAHGPKPPGFGFFRRAIESSKTKAEATIKRAGLKAVERAARAALKKFGNGRAKAT